MLATLRSPVGIVVGWSAFAGSHMVMSHPSNREKLINTLGEKPFLAAYSIIAFATFVPTTLIYARYGAGKGTKFWSGSSRFVRAAGWSTKVLGAISFTQAISTPSPVAAAGKSSLEREAEGEVEESNAVEPKGIQRVTRHGLFFGVALLGIGQLMTRGRLGDILYWGGYPVFWFIGSAHQDYRQRKTLPASFYEKTSLIPFQAIVQGRNSWKEASKEMNWQIAGMTVVGALFVL
ncbi:hypothetical protein BC938DRAFT_472292 [Jimgerdemannia flammicorona]|uniref:NnrU domain-containing protein n=1 Tax=Jimgerdemannia flammicorona TaxID=994334 RepID=A0A433QTZ9_9FUNG|nr:hypothetical protein BC938DRAFT_472292 [Jimgerdemannia flammicorona]